MTTTVRFGGAQIPVTPYVRRNTDTIKKAIDWAAENRVDYLVTPEASLSGYANFIKELATVKTCLKEIEEYAASKQVGLCLGTLWVDYDIKEKRTIKRNQIRYYTKDGNYIGHNNKMVLTPYDIELGIESNYMLNGIPLPVAGKVLPSAGLICADLYGLNSHNGGAAQQYWNMGVRVFIHSTNAERGVDPVKDEIEEIWLEGWIRRGSSMLGPVIVVDNCYTMDGKEYHKTMSQSGVCIKGQWVTKVPRSGTQYFYYDIPVEDLLLEKK